MSARCPVCNSEQFYYVQGVVERHSIESVPDENGQVELIELHETHPMHHEMFEPYLTCENEKCKKQFWIDGREQ